MISETFAHTPVIVWLRKDLRLQDNPSFHAALLGKRKIIPVFIWDRMKVDNGARAASRWWLHHALDSLGKDIAKLGGHLLLAKGKACDILPEIARENHATTIFYGRVYDPCWAQHTGKSGRIP